MAMSENSPAIDWPSIDTEILAGRPLPALHAIVIQTHLPLAAAMVLLRDRYESLRASQPGAFAIPHERYWDGFYS
jgi:hypothetical protein